MDADVEMAQIILHDKYDVRFAPSMRVFDRAQSKSKKTAKRQHVGLNAILFYESSRYVRASYALFFFFSFFFEDGADKKFV